MSRNPYEPPIHDSSSLTTRIMHPDWKWMTLFCFGIGCSILFWIANSPDFLLKPWLLRLHEDVVFASRGLGPKLKFLIPLFVAIPTLMLAIPMRWIYREKEKTVDMSNANLGFLMAGSMLALVNAVLFFSWFAHFYLFWIQPG